ncbi:MAG: hypothetical protein KDK70_03775 [Myxococcales bacterium]|nr:hypothetical protein [Myxococcales bacterium]
MAHFGIISFSSSGPLNTMLALGHALVDRGHTVTAIAFADARPFAEAAGVGFRMIGEGRFPVGSFARSLSRLGDLSGLSAARYSLALLHEQAQIVLEQGPDACRRLGVDALLVNQSATAGGTVADVVGIPFVTVCSAVPLNEDPLVPPVLFPWGYDPGPWGRLRNRLAYRAMWPLVRPIMRSIGQARARHGLPARRTVDELFSPLAQLSHLPEAFDFPRQRLPPWFHYTGPFHTTTSRAKVEFPWERVSQDRPLVYASMGTLQNRQLWVFDRILSACEGLDAQLVVSMGGGAEVDSISAPADVIVVRYAPQLELLARARLAIIHAGMNSTIECLMHAVPMVAIPVTNDQPGAAARIAHSGAGRMVSLRSIRQGAAPLRAAVRSVLFEPAYQQRARVLAEACRASGGMLEAVEIVEEVASTGRPVLRSARSTAERAPSSGR